MPLFRVIVKVASPQRRPRRLSEPRRRAAHLFCSHAAVSALIMQRRDALSEPAALARSQPNEGAGLQAAVTTPATGDARRSPSRSRVAASMAAGKIRAAFATTRFPSPFRSFRGFSSRARESCHWIPEFPGASSTSDSAGSRRIFMIHRSILARQRYVDLGRAHSSSKFSVIVGGRPFDRVLRRR